MNLVGCNIEASLFVPRNQAIYWLKYTRSQTLAGIAQPQGFEIFALKLNSS